MSSESGPPTLPQEVLRDTVGALVIGVLFAMFFQGVLTVQTYVYYMQFPKDPIRTRTLVGLLWILDFIHLVLISDGLYSYTVTNWGNPEALAFSTYALDIHLIPLSLATILCQAFFVHRIYLFSKRKLWLAGPIAIACFGTFALGVAATIQSCSNLEASNFAKPANRAVIVSLFSSGAATDVIIAAVMCYFLAQGRNDTTLARTSSTLTKLIYQVSATGLATSLIAVASLLSYLIKSNSFIFIAIHFSLGRMFTNSLLVSLNARANLVKDNVHLPSSGVVVSVSRSNANDFDTTTQSATVVRTQLEGYEMYGKNGDTEKANFGPNY